MSTELETLQKQFDELQIAKNKVDATVVEKDEKISSLTKQLADLTEAKATGETALKTVTEELNKIKATQKRDQRLALVSEKLGTSAEEAAKLVDSLAAVESDEGFTKLIEVTSAKVVKASKPSEDPSAKKVDEKTLENVKVDNTDASKVVAGVNSDDGIETVRIAIAKFFEGDK